MTDVYVVPCEHRDLPELMNIMTRSFGHDTPFIETFFPNHDTPDGHAKAINTFKGMWQAYPSGVHLVKAVSKAGNGSEQIMGFALWTYMTSSQNTPPEQMADVSFADTEDDKAFARQLWASYVVPRRGAIFDMDRKHPGKGIWVLEFLCVDPSQQRKGAGSKLTNFGLNKAKEEQTDAVVESTLDGEPCYSSCGFKEEIHRMNFDVDNHFRDRRLPELVFMYYSSR